MGADLIILKFFLNLKMFVSFILFLKTSMHVLYLRINLRINPS